MSSLRVLALVTARSGSKGLVGKNVRPFKGHPLLGWTVRQAVRSPAISRVVMSTDCPEMAQVARHYGADVPFLRPKELATDDATSLDVALHALDHLSNAGEDFDVIVLLQPTSPLRLHGDLCGMVDFLQGNWDQCDGVVAVAPLKPSPQWALQVEGHKIQTSPLFESLRRQALPEYFASFGLGWAVKTAALRRERTFYPERSFAWKARREQAVDIDDLCDFLSAEAFFDVLKTQGINLESAYMSDLAGDPNV